MQYHDDERAVAKYPSKQENDSWIIYVCSWCSVSCLCFHNHQKL